MSIKDKKGFTLIELIVVLAVLGILMLVLIFAYQGQLMKARDGKRKADLAKLQQVLEDYLNDKICYSPTLICGQDFAPYLSSVPCDPINKGTNIYYYSVSQTDSCKKWYKIFTNLENKDDPIINKIGCPTPPSTQCGPFNYVVTSPNVETLVQQAGEVYPPAPPLPSPTPISTPTPTPGGGGTPTPTPTPGGATPTPTPTSAPTPTPTPTVCPKWFSCVGQGGRCNYIGGTYQPGAVCNSGCNSCTASGCWIWPLCSL